MTRYVYFAVAGSMVKIGCSNLPERRLTQIAEWVPFKVHLAATMPGGFDVEAALHRMFDHAWSHLEWFHATPDLMAFIGRVAAGLPVAIVAPDPEVPSFRAEGIRQKKALTRKLSAAEKRVFGFEYHRDILARRAKTVPHVVEAVDSYSLPNIHAPSPHAVDVIETYIAELARMPAWTPRPVEGQAA
jgi:T5orf172 domain